MTDSKAAAVVRQISWSFVSVSDDARRKTEVGEGHRLSEMTSSGHYVRAYRDRRFPCCRIRYRCNHPHARASKYSALLRSAPWCAAKGGSRGDCARSGAAAANRWSLLNSQQLRPHNRSQRRGTCSIECGRKGAVAAARARAPLQMHVSSMILQRCQASWASRWPVTIITLAGQPREHHRPAAAGISATALSRGRALVLAEAGGHQQQLSAQLNFIISFCPVARHISGGSAHSTCLV